MTMKETLQQLRERALPEIRQADLPEALENLRVKYLGKKGELTAVLRQMGSLDAAERPSVGQLANEVRVALEEAVAQAGEKLHAAARAQKLSAETLDVTLPGRVPAQGHMHPLTAVQRRIEDIFAGLGFQIADGPEVETDYYNFEALNIPAGHPARDTQDTLYFSDSLLLRTQTSGVQVRTMEKLGHDVRIICPGRVYRSDAVDATHSPMFHQIEGLVVGRGVSMADLRGILELFAREMFGAQTRIRFRPHHFPFTEPSAEVDVSCFVCGGQGCRLCKGEGWIEILGAGVVHPHVLRACGVDPDVYSGYAFGMGLERVVMCRYGIDDMRLLFENDTRFLGQF